MKNFSDNLQSNISKCFGRLEAFKTDIFGNIAQVKDDFKDKLGDLDKYYSESLEEMT
jgi:hypothetical protein